MPDAVLKTSEARKAGTRRSAWAPTASGGIARAAYRELVRAGVNPEPLLAKAGLTARQVKNPEARIGVRPQIAFLNLAAAALDDDFFGVSLARRVDLRELGLLYYVIASSRTMGEALQRAARYSSLQNEGVHILCRQGKDLSIRLDHVGVSRRSDRHQAEFFVAFLLRMCRELSGLDLTPRAIRLAHHRAKIPADVARLFGGAVIFNSSVDELVLPAAVAARPTVKADPYLNKLLVRQFEDALARRRARSSGWRLKVENAMATLLPHGRADVKTICNELGVSARTLARRLASEDKTFAAVLDDLRRDLAGGYLQQPDMPISKIAWLLGYKEPSAFNHAFKRWTKRSPGEVRRRRAIRSAAVAGRGSAAAL